MKVQLVNRRGRKLLMVPRRGRWVFCELKKSLDVYPFPPPCTCNSTMVSCNPTANLFSKSLLGTLAVPLMKRKGSKLVSEGGSEEVGGYCVDSIDLNTCNTYGQVLYNCSASDGRGGGEVALTKESRERSGTLLLNLCFMRSLCTL